MNIEIKVDTSQLNKKLAIVAKYAPVEPKKLLKHQMSLLLKELSDASVPKSIPKTKRNIENTINQSFYRTRNGIGVITYKRYANIRYRKGKVEGKKVPTKAGVVNSFIAKQKQLIGVLAAGWLGGSNPLNVNAKAIAKKQKAYGKFEILDRGNTFSIIVTNMVRYASLAFGGYYPKIVANAVSRRERMLVAMIHDWAKSGKIKYNLPGSLK